MAVNADITPFPRAGQKFATYTKAGGYDPFGPEMPGLSYNAGAYHRGFQVMLKDD